MADNNGTLTAADTNSTDNSVKVVCEDQPAFIQPWTGIDLNEPGSVFHLERHTYFWVACGIAAILATFISLYLIYKHLKNFNRPLEQVHVVRILLIVPIYAIISWFSFRYYTKSVYYNVIRDCYEAFVVYSFYALIMQFLGDNLHVQKEALSRKPKRMPYPLPLCCIGYYNPTTPTFLKRMRALVLQYTLVRTLMTIVAVVTQAASHFCEESMSPAYGHFWYMTINFVSVSSAMYGLIMIYFTIKDDIAEHKPLPKFLSIKLVILLTLWQNMILSILVHFKVIHATQYWTRTNIANGIQSMLVCFEMLFAAIYHHISFSAAEYTITHDPLTGEVIPGSLKLNDKQEVMGVLKALGMCLNPMDILRDMYRSGQHLVYDIRAWMQGRKGGDYEDERGIPLSGQPGGANNGKPQQAEEFNSESTAALFGGGGN